MPLYCYECSHCNTYVEVNMQPYTIRNEQLFTKVGWTPFDGTEAAGRVQRVYLRGELVYELDQRQGPKGGGKLL